MAAPRKYSEELKAQVIAECDAAGSSVAKVAMSHGINANVVHRWRQLARDGAQATVAAVREFMPVQIAPAVVPQGESRRDIEIELRLVASHDARRADGLREPLVRADDDVVEREAGA